MFKAYLKTFLPWLLIKLTGEPRYLPTIEWSDKSWVHNIFRAYELVFWRRKGLRIELTVVPFHSEDGQLLYTEVYCHTFEALCANTETLIRQWLGRFRLVPARVSIPVLAPAGFSRPATIDFPYLFAIALDATSVGTVGTGNPISWSHTCTGSNLGLILLVASREQYNTNTAAYNAVSMTYVIGSNSTNNTGDFSQVFRLIAPATGANNATYTGGAGGTGDTRSGMSISFSGADQTTLVGAFDKATTTGTQLTYSLTTTRANSYTVESQWCQTSSNPFTQLQSQTEIDDRDVGSRRTAGTYKSQGATGSKSLGFESSNSDVKYSAFAEVMELGAAGPANVKTWDGLALASVKTVNGLAIASVKSIDGLT